MGVESAFGIKVPDQAMDLRTIGEFSECICRHVENRSPDEVWQTVQGIASEILDIPRSEIRRDSRWDEDLKVD